MTKISFRIKKRIIRTNAHNKKTFDLTTHTSYFWNSLIWNLCVMFHVFLSLTFNPASWCLTITLVLHILSIDVSYSYYIYFSSRTSTEEDNLVINCIFMWFLCALIKNMDMLYHKFKYKIFLEILSPFHIYLCKIAKNVRKC